MRRGYRCYERLEVKTGGSVEWLRVTLGKRILMILMDTRDTTGRLISFFFWYFRIGNVRYDSNLGRHHSCDE
jgi:hypothetical protein